MSQNDPITPNFFITLTGMHVNGFAKAKHEYAIEAENEGDAIRCATTWLMDDYPGINPNTINVQNVEAKEHANA